MGNPRNMSGDGGFSVYLYADHENWSEVTINGIKAKVVKNISDPQGIHTSLPLASGKSDMYLRLDKFGNPTQARVYNGRMGTLDFDWGHEHYNNPGKGGDGKKFAKGVVHVQEYHYKQDGTVDRISQNVRLMSESEIKLFGDILKHFNPKVKFK